MLSVLAVIAFKILTLGSLALAQDAPSAPASAKPAAQATTPTQSVDKPPAHTTAAETPVTDAAPTSATTSANVAPKRRKKTKHHKAAIAPLPAYVGAPRSSDPSLVRPAYSGFDHHEGSSDTFAGKASGGPSLSARPAANASPVYENPAQVPLPEAPGASAVSEQDLAPGPVIQSGQVQRLPITDEKSASTTGARGAPSFLHFGLQAGETLTDYRHYQAGAREGALLLGAQFGVSNSLWDGSTLLGVPLIGEENLRLDYISSSDTGLAQMIQVRIDSLVFLDPQPLAPRSIAPLLGLGVGWANGDFNGTYQAGTADAHVRVESAVISPTLGVRWRIAAHTAIDLKAESLLYFSRASYFGKFNGLAGVVILF